MYHTEPPSPRCALYAHQPPQLLELCVSLEHRRHVTDSDPGAELHLRAEEEGCAEGLIDNYVYCLAWTP